MAKSDANIHHDGYNTDSTDEILPLGIYPEINVSYETTNANASPAIYFDSYGHAVVPLLGGIAIRDLNAEETKTLGYFSPKKHDGGGYVIQSSYTFMDASNRIVCPTSNNHVLMLRATDENGNVLPEFEKVLDIDIKAAAEAALGKELTQNLLSVVFDYDGNLWFATGGFRIYPQRQQQGVIGYIARSAIDAILNGEQADLSKAVFVHELTPGEGAENGIAASKDGAVILTNQNCYLLRAEEGVDVVWCTPYESAGAKVSGEGDKTTGGGLAWGGGCSPTLTPNLVLFTDNQDTVNLLALDMKTGEVVASAPVLDDLPEGYQVAVENSAIVRQPFFRSASGLLQRFTFGRRNAMIHLRKKQGGTTMGISGNEWGFQVGKLPKGALDKISDVPGVTVGHCTLADGVVQTGVTALLPHPGDIFHEKVLAASHVINGFGKTTGLVQIDELGTLETPILFTNTLSVGTAQTALVKYMLEKNPDICETTGSVNPVVCECNDCGLNDIRGLHVTEQHVFAALADCKADFAEGAVGAGRGMRCHGLKGGIGSASRVVELDCKQYTIGALVLSNHALFDDLIVAGKPIHTLLDDSIPPHEDKGSIITVLATDIPLSERQLRRLCRRALVGLSRTGSYCGNGSGEIVIAFTTANRVPHYSDKALLPMTLLHDDAINPLFRAVAECVEESVLSSLLHAETVTGSHGRTFRSLTELLKRDI